LIAVAGFEVNTMSFGDKVKGVFSKKKKDDKAAPAKDAEKKQ
jgi:hypothetical protein